MTHTNGPTRGRAVVVVAGMPGTGKSALGAALAPLVAGVVIDKDAIVAPLVDAALQGAGEAADLDGAYYKQHLSPAAYEVIESFAAAVLAAGSTPVLVAPYERARGDPGWRDRLASRLDAHVHVVWLRAHPDIVRRRLQQRGARRDQGKLARWSDYLARVDFDATPPWPHEAVDTSHDAEAMIARAARRIARALSPTPGH